MENPCADDAKRERSRSRRRRRGRKKQINVTPKDADGVEMTRDKMKEPLVVVEKFPYLVVSKGRSSGAAATVEESSREINVTPTYADGVELTLDEMNPCADHVRCFSRSQESGEAVAFVDAKGKSSGVAADAKGKSSAAAYVCNNQSLDLHRLQIGSPERTLDCGEEQIEGLDWDEAASADAKGKSSRARRRRRGRKKQINVTPKDADGAEIAHMSTDGKREIISQQDDNEQRDKIAHAVKHEQEPFIDMAFPAIEGFGRLHMEAVDMGVADRDELTRNQPLALDRLQIGSPERTLDRDEEQIEGLDWDEADLKEEIDSYIKRCHGLPDYDDDEFWASYDQQQLTELKIRLALYRIRAHEWPKLKGLSNAELKEKYPLNMLEENEYFYRFECDVEWYFDPEYCEYANLEDYQRLTLRDNGEYKDWEYYNETRSTLESDQKFVQFWEKLASKTKWIPNVLETNSLEWYRITQVAFYHAVKIAAEFPEIYTRLLRRGFTEYLWSIKYDNYWLKGTARIYFEIWKLVAKQKMNFKDALDHLKCSSEMGAQLEIALMSPSPVYHYKTCMAHIDANHTEAEAYQLTMEAVKTIVPKQKIYYDYAKKKLDIAAKMGLIP